VRSADLSSAVPGSWPGARDRRLVVDLALNGSDIRDTARVLRMSPTTVIAV
jgi:hypothetical protein